MQQIFSMQFSVHIFNNHHLYSCMFKAFQSTVQLSITRLISISFNSRLTTQLIQNLCSAKREETPQLAQTSCRLLYILLNYYTQTHSPIIVYLFPLSTTHAAACRPPLFHCSNEYRNKPMFAQRNLPFIFVPHFECLFPALQSCVSRHIFQNNVDLFRSTHFGINIHTIESGKAELLAF